ncbi:MAG: hypothetical protein MUF53_07200 [Gemmatimonadaceae bacterium]|jgi:acetyltransferase-like isoleucine patch superfamily enzyme|nr:hypothetical protein [Gemmatimonadaceae bacterium]
MRRAIKVGLSLVLEGLLVPFWLPCLIGRSDPAREASAWFTGCTQLLALLPGRLGSRIRVAFLRRTLDHCSRECYIGYGTIFSSWRVSIADSVYVGSHCILAACSIGRDTLLGSGVHVLSGTAQHGIDDLDTPIRLQPSRHVPARIGADCWLGNQAIVTTDVGDHAVVAAGAVVVKPVEPWAIVGGNPARTIRSRRAERAT